MVEGRKRPGALEHDSGLDPYIRTALLELREEILSRVIVKLDALHAEYNRELTKAINGTGQRLIDLGERVSTAEQSVSQHSGWWKVLGVVGTTLIGVGGAVIVSLIFMVARLAQTIAAVAAVQ